MFQNFIDILTSPSSVFTRLQEKPTVLFPLLLLIAISISTQVGYIMLTDHSFIVDQAVDQAMATNNSDINEAELREDLSNLNPAILAVPGIIAVPIFLLLITSLYAAYLNFVAKFGLQEHTFKTWFSVVCWTSIPAIFTGIAAWSVLLSSATGQVPQTELQVLSINSVLALNSDNSLLTIINLPQLWSMGLLVLAYRHFTGQKMLKSALVALGPYILIYGVWAMITLL